MKRIQDWIKMHWVRSAAILFLLIIFFSIGDTERPEQVSATGSSATYVILTILMLVVPALAVAAIYLLAQVDVFFTTVEEGFCKGVMVNGKFDRFIMHYKGHAFSKKWDVVEDTHPDAQEQPFSIWGIYWLGVWPAVKVYTYDNKWTSWSRDPVTQTMKATPRIERGMNKIMLKRYVYACKTLRAETKDEQLPIDVQSTHGDRCINPYTAYFGNKDPHMSVEAKFEKETRTFVGNRHFDQLSTDRGHGAGDDYQSTMTTASGTVPSVVDEIARLYGMAVDDLNVQTFDISTEGLNEMQKSSIAAWEAKNKARAAKEKKKEIKTLAEGEADAARAKADGDADATRTMAQAQADAARTEATGTADATRTMAQGTADAVRTKAEAEAFEIETLGASLEKPGGSTVGKLKAIEKLGPTAKIIITDGKTSITDQAALMAATVSAVAEGKP